MFSLSIFAFMLMYLWIDQLMLQLKETSLIEYGAVIFGIINVILSARKSIWLYPTGIVNTSLFIYLLFQNKYQLYASALLNIYYLIMSIYGWLNWYRERESNRDISRATKYENKIAFILFTISVIIFYILLKKYTTSNVALWDALVAGLACSGMWLLSRMRLENWLWLLASNIIAIPMLILKDLYLTAVLNIILSIMAIVGYRNWNNFIEKRSQQTT